MIARPGESVEELVDRLGAEDAITPEDAGEILAFDRFLRAIETWPRGGDGRRVIPAEWHPYIAGEGPAPAEEASQ